jgi:hypothetical protein
MLFFKEHLCIFLTKILSSQGEMFVFPSPGALRILKILLIFVKINIKKLLKYMSIVHDLEKCDNYKNKYREYLLTYQVKLNKRRTCKT